MTSPLSQCITLPSLMSLDFHGASGYLEELVVRVELPALCKFSIRLFNDIFFEIPQFCQLIPRLNLLRPSARAIVKHSADFVGVSFQDAKLLDESYILGTSCRQLDWQLSFVTQILNQLPSLLSSVYLLDIQSGDELPTGEEDVEPAQWLELFQPFTHVTQVYVSEKLVPSIVQALVAGDMTAEVLPELTSLHLSGCGHFQSLTEVAPWHRQQQLLRERELERRKRELEWRVLERRELKQQDLKRRDLEQRMQEWQDLEWREMGRREREWEELERQELERRGREREWDREQQQQQQQLRQTPQPPGPPQHQPQQPPIGPLPSGTRPFSGTGFVPGLLPMQHPPNVFGVPPIHQIGMGTGAYDSDKLRREHGPPLGVINPQ